MADETPGPDAPEPNGGGPDKPPADATRTAGEAFLGEGTGEEEKPPLQPHEDPWEAPRMDKETGIAIDPAGLPVNLRLRSLALAQAGAEEDPGKLASREMIADAAARVKAYEEAYPPLKGMTTAELEGRASKERVDISGAANNDERAALILAARPELV